MDTLRVSMGVDLAACRTTKRWKRWFEPAHLEDSGPNEAVDRFRRLEEAAKFYTSIFRNSKIVSVTRYGDFWEKLSEGGETQRCGWLKDRYGVSWQVVPTVLGLMLQDKDARKSKRVMDALMQMDKLDIRRLKEAYEQR